MAPLKLVIFDLGETLFCYEGIALDWAGHSTRAWAHAFDSQKVSADQRTIKLADAVLEHYNTRSVPREREYSSAHIFGEALTAAGIDVTCAEDVANGYFDYFRSGIKPYPASCDVLRRLKAAGMQLAALTDVAYGMSRKLVEDDLRRVGILDYFDEWLTSVDVGYRKPHSAGFQQVLALFQLHADEAVYVGNERKDIIGAAGSNMISVLVDRDNRKPEWGQSHTVQSLRQLPAALERERSTMRPSGDQNG